MEEFKLQLLRSRFSLTGFSRRWSTFLEKDVSVFAVPDRSYLMFLQGVGVGFCSGRALDRLFLRFFPPLLSITEHGGGRMGLLTAFR